MTAILFDIDGTLVDTNYLHVEAWAHAFADTGFAVDAWRIHRAIGMDSQKLLDELVPDASREQRERAQDRHERHYADLGPRLRAFGSVRELLRDLASRGVTVVLATSAPEDELAGLRRTLQVEDAIAVVTSSADVDEAKPNPDIVRVALERAEVPASEAVMVGDTVWDCLAATALGVRFVGVQSGGIAVQELRDAGASAVYADAAALLDDLDRVLEGDDRVGG